MPCLLSLEDSAIKSLSEVGTGGANAFSMVFPASRAATRKPLLYWIVLQHPEWATPFPEAVMVSKKKAQCTVTQFKDTRQVYAKCMGRCACGASII